MLRLTPKVGGKKISNFDIFLHRRVNVHLDSQQESVPHIEVSLNFERGEPGDRTRVPLSRLETVDWRALDYRATSISSGSQTADPGCPGRYALYLKSRYDRQMLRPAGLYANCYRI